MHCGLTNAWSDHEGCDRERCEHQEKVYVRGVLSSEAVGRSSLSLDPMTKSRHARAQLGRALLTEQSMLRVMCQVLPARNYELPINFAELLTEARAFDIRTRAQFRAQRAGSCLVWNTLEHRGCRKSPCS